MSKKIIRRFKKDRPGLIDSLLFKLTSRKLLVWIVATVAFFLGSMPADLWFYTNMIYIMAEASIDVIIPIIAGFGKNQADREEEIVEEILE